MFKPLVQRVNKKGAILLLYASAFLYCNGALAVFNGTYEESLPSIDQHKYAGLIYGYSTLLNGYGTCGVSLVKSPLIPSHLENRVVVIAKHCIEHQDNVHRVSVTFANDPGMIFENSTRYPTEVNPNGKVYQGTTFYTIPSNKGNSQVAANDMAIVILDEPVVGIDPVQLAPIGFVDNLTNTDSLRMTGYGIIVWGNSNSTGIQSAPSTGAGNMVG